MPSTEHLPAVTPNAGRFAPWHSSRQRSGAGDGGRSTKYQRLPDGAESCSRVQTRKADGLTFREVGAVVRSRSMRPATQPTQDRRQHSCSSPAIQRLKDFQESVRWSIQTEGQRSTFQNYVEQCRAGNRRTARLPVVLLIATSLVLFW